MSTYKFSSKDLLQFLQRLRLHVEGERDPNLYAAIAYIPFGGWLVPYLFRKDQALCEFHAIQALKLNLGATLLFFCTWLLKVTPILSWILNLLKFNPIVTDFLIYVTWVFLIAYSGLGMYKAYNSEIYEFPYFGIIEKKIKEFLNIKEK